MATYYIAPNGNDNNSGSNASPWRTLNHANDEISPGDTVVLKDGNYTGPAYKSTITVNNTTWKAENRHGAVIDGLWSWAHYNAAERRMPMPEGFGASGEFDQWLSIQADNVTIEGIVWQNIPCEIINALGDNPTIKWVVGYVSLGQTINVNGTSNSAANRVVGATVVDNVSCYASMVQFVPVAQGDRPDPATAAIRVGRTDSTLSKPVLVARNLVMYCFGEGMDMGKYNVGTADSPMIVEDNTVVDCAHKHLYVLHSRHMHLRRNFIYATNQNWVWGGGEGSSTDPGGGICIVDEQWDTNRYVGYDTGHIYYYNNLVVNTAVGIDVGKGRMNNLYFGYNTLVAGPASGTSSDGLPRPYIILGGSNGAKTDCLFEHNILHHTNVGNPGSGSVVSSGDWASRGNIYHTNKSVGTPFLANGGVKGNPQLANPTVAVTSASVTRATSWAAFNATRSFSANNYKLTANSALAINNATAGSALNGVTPPSVARATDLFNKVRTQPDIGAHEYGATDDGGGGDPPPDPEPVTASFTMRVGGSDVTSVIAGLAVTLDDTSTTGGASTVTNRLWEFGDGSPEYDAPNSTAFEHTWSTPGVYSISLSVTNSDGSQDVEIKTLTVTAQEGVQDVKVDVVQFALNTTAGNQAVTLSLGGASPLAAIAVASSATAHNSPTTGAALSYGVWALNGGDWCHSLVSAHNSVGASVKSLYTEDGFIVLLGDSGAVVARATIASVAADLMTINVIDPPDTSVLVTMKVFSGSSLRVRRVTVPTGAAGSSSEVQTQFPVSAIIAACGWQPQSDVAVDWISFSTGVASRIGQTSTLHQSSSAWGIRTATTNSPTLQKMNNSLVMRNAGIAPESAFANVFAEYIDGNRLGVRLTTGVSSARASVCLLLIGTGSLETVRGHFDTPATPSVVPLPFLPQAAQGMIMFVDAAAGPVVHTGANAGSFGIVLSDGTHTYTTAIYHRSGQSVSSTGSVVAPTATSYTHLGAEYEEASIAFAAIGTRGGANVAFTTAQAPAVEWPYLMIEGGDVPTGPQAEFAAVPANALVGEDIQFISLSSGGGESILTYEWDFGDGATATVESPVHAYGDPGLYTVSLVITTATGVSTETKQNFIDISSTTGGGGGEIDVLHGPHIPTSITPTSTNFIGLFSDKPNYGTHTHQYDFPFLTMSQAGAGSAANPPGVVIGYWDNTNSRIVIRLPNGSVGYLPITLSAPASPIPPEEEQEVVFQITSGADDADQAAGVIDASDVQVSVSSGTQWGYTRWPSLGIPQGAQITSAKIAIYLHNPNSIYRVPGGIAIYGDKAPDVGVLPTTTNAISDRPRTTEVVAWNDNALMQGWVETPELADILQEMVNQVGWTTDSGGGFIWDGQSSSSLNFRSFDFDPTLAPKLLVHYTVA